MGGIVQGIFGGGDSASDAAGAQLQGTQAGIAEQRRQFDITQRNLAPFLSTGLDALNQQRILLGLGPIGTGISGGIQQQPVAPQQIAQQPAGPILRSGLPSQAQGAPPVRLDTNTAPAFFQSQDAPAQVTQLGLPVQAAPAGTDNQNLSLEQSTQRTPEDLQRQALADQARINEEQQLRALQSALGQQKTIQEAGTTGAIEQQRRIQDAGLLSAQEQQTAALGRAGELRQFGLESADIQQQAALQGAFGRQEEIRNALPDILSRAGELRQFGLESARLEQDAALEGAIERQSRIEEAFKLSPGQAFLKRRQEKALLRNQAALGGLGGGNIRTALQEQAAGIAAQDLGRFQRNIEAGTTQGLGQSALQRGFAGQDANQFQRNIETGFAQGLDQSSLGQNQGLQGLNVGLLTQGQIQPGNIQNRLGLGVAQGLGQTQQVQNRLANLSGGGQTATTNLAQFGGQQSANIANLLQAGGQAQASGILGQQQANSALGGQFLGAGLGAAAGGGLLGAEAATAFGGSVGLGTILGLLSDRRLKENSVKLGQYKGLNWYRWDWTEDIDLPNEGFIAQEVQSIYPDAVNDYGYLTVDYRRIYANA